MPNRASIVAAKIIDVTKNVGSISAGTTTTTTLTVGGARTDQFAYVSAPSLEANLVLGNAWVSAAGTVSVTIGNLTASPIDPASQVFKVMIF